MAQRNLHSVASSSKKSVAHVGRGARRARDRTGTRVHSTVPCPCGPVETLGSEDQDTTPTEQPWHSMRTTPQPQSGCMAVLAPSSLRMGRIIGIDQSSNDGRNIWNHSTGEVLSIHSGRPSANSAITSGPSAHILFLKKQQ